MKEYNSIHIKKRPDGKYQVQVYRDKKSHSATADNFFEAIRERRKIYEKLGIDPKSPLPNHWGVSNNKKKKKSVLPDGSAMETGISRGIRKARTGRIEHSIQVNYTYKGKHATKAFYMCTTDVGEFPTNSQIWNAYALATIFRAKFLKEIEEIK